MPMYYTIITDAGQALLAEAMASGQPVVLTQFGVGDGAGAPVIPDPTMTTLTNEVYRGGISSLGTSPEQPNAMVAQLIIPKESGGYTVREVALFTDDGTIFSIGNYPDQPKPPTDSGYAVKLDMRYLLVVSDTSAITVVIPPGDYLTQEEADILYLSIGKNLSEIAVNGETAQQVARDNLGLGTAATHAAEDFLPSTYTPPPVDVPVTSVNGEVGDVQLSAGDVGAYSKTESDQRYEPIDSAWTKQESDDRYLGKASGIQDVQLGAEVDLGDDQYGYGLAAPAGHTITYIAYQGNGDAYMNAKCKPIQVQTNNVWRTISG